MSQHRDGFFLFFPRGSLLTWDKLNSGPVGLLEFTVQPGEVKVIGGEAAGEGR
jgi:hypothetical protein